MALRHICLTVQPHVSEESNRAMCRRASRRREVNLLQSRRVLKRHPFFEVGAETTPATPRAVSRPRVVDVRLAEKRALFARDHSSVPSLGGPM